MESIELMQMLQRDGMDLDKAEQAVHQINSDMQNIIGNLLFSSAAVIGTLLFSCAASEQS